MHHLRMVSLFFGLAAILWLMSCETNPRNSGNKRTGEKLPKPVKIDYDQIKKRGKLVALTGYSATSYFIYRGQPMGYEYELLQKLADNFGLELEVKIVEDMNRIFHRLNKGDGDLVAHSMTVTLNRKEKVLFTEHHNIIRQVLIQRLPEEWRTMKRHEIDAALIRNPIELIGKTVHVRKNSSYYHRLQNLTDEIGGTINIQEIAGDFSTGELIQKVARGDIDYTIADQNIALINKAYYSNIDIKTAVSLPQRIAWAVRKTSPILKDKIDAWINDVRGTETYNVIYNKYFKNRSAFRARMKSEYFSHTGNKISRYDEYIKNYAKDIGWDWRLLAAQIYQESRFDPKEKSWAGAKGLMQVLPKTAAQYGIHDLYNPKKSIQAGTNFLQWLQDYWKAIPDSAEQLKFILASYNTGQGHVQDARRLARKFGKDPDLWNNNVADYLLLKSKEKYFNDPVVEYGYCRGEEPVTYVNAILQRYTNYRKFIEK
ncbi:MAG: transporter substrate-binding domain-containing protein [Caldithrix sp.]|nr:transporter substrate-binding domain-containing protein [Caldithrix sp.]